MNRKGGRRRLTYYSFRVVFFSFLLVRFVNFLWGRWTVEFVGRLMYFSLDIVYLC